MNLGRKCGIADANEGRAIFSSSLCSAIQGVMKVIAGAALLASCSAMASGNLVPHATGVTLGQSSNHLPLFSGIHNPAMGELMVDKDERFRFNYFLAVSNATEYGQVDNFVDEIDDLIDILDDPSSSNDPIEETLDRFNDLLQVAEKEGYLKTATGLYVPGLPLYWRIPYLPGTLSFELNFETQILASILADDLIFDGTKPKTASAAYLKSAIQTKAAVGYSQKLELEDIQQLQFLRRFDGELYVGARFNIYQLELSKQVFQLQLLDGAGIEDVVEDEYEKNLRKSTNIGLDIGAVWIADRYRLGLSLANINAPSFRYGEIGLNCGDYPSASDQQTNCYVTDYFATQLGKIANREKHKKLPSITVDGSYNITPEWAVAGNLELLSYDDAVGLENQWFTAATTYHFNNIFIPDLRASYRRNLAGIKLDYINLGVTFGDTVNLDFSMALKDVEVDGQSAPRGAGFAISVEERF